MTDWISPRAYIIRMEGRQTAQLHRTVIERMNEAYKAHVEKLGNPETPLTP